MQPSEAGQSTKILVVDDEEDVLKAITTTLELYGFTGVQALSDPAELLNSLAEQELPVVILDLNMGPHDGREILPKLIERYPDITVIVATGVNDITTALQCVRAGAFDFLTKPINPDQLDLSVRRALEHCGLRRENQRLNRTFAAAGEQIPVAFSKILTSDPAMLQLIHYAQAIAPTVHPVLITGETGVGKELFAQAIHLASGRTGKFVAVNTAGLDDMLFSDMLFGHQKGAFTGADRDFDGLIIQAEGGTLFLDEIGDLSLQSQVKLLRLLQEHEYYPLGSSRPRHGNARVIFATNHSPETLQNSPCFRKDLYYRISTHRLSIPPLRTRLHDVPRLTSRFIQEACSELGRTIPTSAEHILTALQSYSFPGNIRELKAVITDWISRGGQLKHCPLGTSQPTQDNIIAKASEELSNERNSTNLRCHIKWGHELPSLKETEWLLVKEALRRSGNCQTKAANLIGVSQQAISMRIKRHNKV